MNGAPSAGRRCRAVFLDRDGTLVREAGYLRDPEGLALEEAAGRAVAMLNQAGFRVVVVTNQSGIARGLYTPEDVQAVHAKLHRLLGAQHAHLDGIYYCPHHPDEGEGPSRCTCSCRKPGTGLLEMAVGELGIALPGSYLVGDKRTDLETARRAGLTAVLVMTGYGRQEWHACLGDPAGPQPDRVARNMGEAVDWILWHEDGRLPRLPEARKQPRKPVWSNKWTSPALLEERVRRHRWQGDRIFLAAFSVEDLCALSAWLGGADDPGDIRIAVVEFDFCRLPGSRALSVLEQSIEELSGLESLDYLVLARKDGLEAIIDLVRPDSPDTGPKGTP